MTPGQAPPPEPARWPAALAGLGAFVLSLVVTGYRSPGDNHAIQLPLVARIVDAKTFSTDPFVDTLDRYASPFWWLAAHMSELFGLGATLAILFLAIRALALYAGARLGAALLGTRAGALGGLLFVALGPGAILGGGTLVARYAEQTSAAVALWMLAAAALLERRRWTWAVALGAMALCNSLYAVYAVSFFCAGALWHTRLRHGSARLTELARPWLAPAALATLIAAPALVGGLALVGQPAPDDWASLAVARFPHHLDPLAAGPWAWLHFVAVLVALFVVLSARQRALRTTLVRDDPERARDLNAGIAHLLVWTLVALAWLAAGVVSGGLEGPRLLLVLQPARATDLWLAVAGIVLAGSVLEWSARQQSRRGVIAAAALAALALAHGRGDLRQLALIALVAVALVALASVLRRRLPVALAVALGAVASGVVFKAPIIAERGLVEGFAGAWHPRSPGIGAAIAARDLIEPGEVVLVDPSWDLFRALSGRAVYTTWKDGAAMLWAPEFAPLWRTRMANLRIDVRNMPADPRAARERLQQRYAELSPEAVTALADEVDVWIVSAAPQRAPVGVRVLVWDEHAGTLTALQ